MRRLTAALSKDLLIICDAEIILPGRGRSPPKKLGRKERKVRKEMKGGNGVREANVVTLCSKCEISHCVSQKRFRVADEVRRRIFSHKERKERKEMKGGNGVREANVVTLCSKCAFQNDEADNLLWM